MSETTPLHEALLELGLEDWIALPEVLATLEVRDFIDGDRATWMVSLALVDLLKQGRIQVWSARWPDEPMPMSPALGESVLLDRRSYSFDTEAGIPERAYYVNVENFHALRST